MQSKFIIIDRQAEATSPTLSSRWFSKTSWVPWSDFPEGFGNFVYNLYVSNSLFQSCVDLTASETGFPNIATNLLLYGFAVILNDGSLLDPRFIRFNGDRSRFYFQRPGLQRKYYDSADHTLLFTDNYNVYPVPFVYPIIKDVQTLTNISEHNLAQTQNGFASNTLVSLNNGVPSAEVQSEIERMFNEKFSGPSNAGRIMISFCDSKDNAPDVHSLPVDDYFSQFSSAVDYARENIFSKFRLTPTLLGINLKSYTSSLSETEYDQQYELFQKFTVAPLKKLITDLYNETA